MKLNMVYTRIIVRMHFSDGKCLQLFTVEMRVIYSKYFKKNTRSTLRRCITAHILNITMVQ